MYALPRMLPASLRLETSISPNSVVVPGSLRNKRSHSRFALSLGTMSKVRPVRSPSMCISTATTTSSALPATSGRSRRPLTEICGTLIMILRSVICESAVAA